MKTLLPGSRAALAALLVAMTCSAAAASEPDTSQGLAPPTQWQVEAGVGSEWQTSPLLRLSPEGTLIRLPGLQRRRGSHGQAAAQVMGELAAWAPCSATLAADIRGQRAPAAPDFDLAMASVHPAVHCATAWGSLSLGLQRQRIDVARERFRRIDGWQLDWTRSDGESHWTALLDLARWRHPEELADLDARAHTLLVQRHQALDGAYWQGLDLAAFAGLERNRHGFDEFSQRNLTLQATLQGGQGRWGWSAGALWQAARFRGSAFAEVAQRRDRAAGADLAVWCEIDDGPTLRLEAGAVRSRSNTTVYDNDQRHLAVLLQWAR